MTTASHSDQYQRRHLVGRYLVGRDLVVIVQGHRPIRPIDGRERPHGGRSR